MGLGEADVRTALYRFFDADDRLLYVGISLSPVVRQQQHRATAEWYGEVARQTVSWHPSRAAARAAERDAIESERPIWNREFNRKRSAAQADAIRRRWWLRRTERWRRDEERAAAAKVEAERRTAVERAAAASAPCSHGQRVICRKCATPAQWELVMALLALKESRNAQKEAAA